MPPSTRTALRDLPPSERPPLRIIGGEILAFAASSLLYPFGIRTPRRRTPRKGDQRTVVLVHGYLGNRSSFFPLAAYLRAHGVKQVLSFGYSGSRGIAGAAIELRDFLRAHVRGGRIDLVCHSLGGVVACMYLQLLGGARRVDRCITLGTPHRGTYNAYWLLSRVGRELRPDSPLLERLAETRSAASRVRFSAIAAGSDNIVVPRVFSAADDDLVHVRDVGHMGLLFSPAVFSEVYRRLTDRP